MSSIYDALKGLGIEGYLDCDIVSALTIFFYWSGKPRAKAFYLTAVVCFAFVISHFNSLLLREPMPLMVE